MQKCNLINLSNILSLKLIKNNTILNLKLNGKIFRLLKLHTFIFLKLKYILYYY